MFKKNNIIMFLFILIVLIFSCKNTNVSTDQKNENAKDLKSGDIGLKEINFGIISTESTENLKKGFDPFLKDMESALGVPVNAFFAGDYAGIIEGMRFNKVQVAWFGNKSAMEAVDRAEGEIFAQTVDAEGNPGYWSLLITHKDRNDLNSIEDVLAKGKELDFGNGDVNSTSGYLIPSYYLWAKHNVDPKKYFKTARNANHGANIMAVAMKQVDFATNNTENFSKFKKSNPKEAANIKIIWQSPLIPSDPFVWRKDLPKEAKARIKAFLLGYGRPGLNKTEDQVKYELEVLAGVSSGFAPFNDSSNAQLIPIREIDLAKEKMKIENDEKMSAKMKQEKIAEINKKLKELEEYKNYMAKL